MRSTWSEPYLWLHLAGLAAVPLLLELCLLGLKAVDSPLALILVALVGIGPIVWMQWNQPFSIFSLTPLVLQPNRMTETQRRILAQFKAPVGRVITVVVAVLALVLLWQLQQWLPFVNRTVDLPAGRLGGLILAAGAFLLSHLFLQVPASVVPVLLTPDQQLAPPHPVSQIPRDFTLVGLGVKQILPAPAPPASPTLTPPAPTAPSAQPTDLLQEEKRVAVAEPEPSDLIQAELVNPATAPANQPTPERIQAELITTEPDLSSGLAELEQGEPEATSVTAPAEVEPVESAADPVEAVPLEAGPLTTAPADGTPVYPSDESVASPVEPPVDLIQSTPTAIPVERSESAPAELDSEPEAAEIAAAELITAALLADSDFGSNSNNGSRPGSTDSDGAAPTARVFPPEAPATEPPAATDRSWPDVRDTVVTVGLPPTNPFDEPAAQLDTAAFEAPADPKAAGADPSSPPPKPQASDTIVRVDNPTTESTDP